MIAGRALGVPVIGALVGCAMFAAGCTPERDPASLFAPEAVGRLVVEATLIVDQPLPSVRLTRTQSPNAPYSRLQAGVPRATVVIRSGARTWDYISAGGSAGLYVPHLGQLQVAADPVLPQTTYELLVVTESGERVRAVTTTPGRFAINAWELMDAGGSSLLRRLQTFDEAGVEVYDHPDNQLQYAEGLLDGRFTGPDAAAYDAFGFQVALFSLDPAAPLVIDPAFLDEEDLADLPRAGASPMLAGEDRYVRLPWFGVFYEGRHLYKVFAVDRNWFDLVRTLPVGGGFGVGGNLGDGVDPPLFRVEGGIGLFGSASVDSTGFTILPR